MQRRELAFQRLRRRRFLRGHLFGAQQLDRLADDLRILPDRVEHQGADRGLVHLLSLKLRGQAQSHGGCGGKGEFEHVAAYQCWQNRVGRTLRAAPWNVKLTGDHRTVKWLHISCLLALVD